MYRTGDRNQTTLMPPSVEDYVSQDNPVRAYDAFIEAMDLKDLGIKLEDDKVGNPCYHPKAMLKLFVDGTKINANSGVKSNWTKKRCDKSLKHIDERITKILAECEQTDAEEENQASHVHMKEELTDAKAFKEKVEQILEKLKKDNKTQLNTVDPDCRAMSSIKGIHPAYNNQMVVDNKNGLIVSVDTINEVTDINQFATQIEKANEVLKEPCSTACADTGYSDIDEMEKVDLNNIEVIIPEKEKRDSQKTLTYDPENDCFTCEAVVFRIISKRFLGISFFFLRNNYFNII